MRADVSDHETDRNQAPALGRNGHGPAIDDGLQREPDYWRLLVLRRELSDAGFVDVGRLCDVEVLRESLRRPGAWANGGSALLLRPTRAGGAAPGGAAPAATAPAESVSPTRPGPSPAASSGPAPDRTWIEIEVVDTDGQPYASESFTLGLPDGTLRRGQLDPDGRFRADEIFSGHCRFDLPDLVALALDQEEGAA